MGLPIRSEDFFDRDYTTVEDLYGLVPPEIAENTRIVMNGYGNPDHSNSLQKARDFYNKNILMFKILADNPGTSRFTEIVYGIRDDEPEGTIKSFTLREDDFTYLDEWALRTLPCLGVKDRLDQVTTHTEKYVRKILENSDEAYIANFGSGLGRDTIRIARNPELRKHVRVDLIDTDQKALEKAREIAKYAGIEDRVQTINRSIMELGDEFKGRYHTGLLVGILCPLPSRTCNFVLRKIYPTLKENAFLTASNASKVMKENDVSTFREKVLGWGLVYKDENDLSDIVREQDMFIPVEHYYDDRLQNVMLVAQKTRAVK